jgi:hypothetical protein
MRPLRAYSLAWICLWAALALAAAASCGKNGGTAADAGPGGGAGGGNGSGSGGGEAQSSTVCNPLAERVCAETAGCVVHRCETCGCDRTFVKCLGATETPPACPKLGCPQPQCCSADNVCQNGLCRGEGQQLPQCGQCLQVTGDCTVDSQCKPGSICEPIPCACSTAKTCVGGCDSGAVPCPTGQMCKAGRCAPAQCTADAQCPVFFSCASSTGCTRIKCLTNLDCKGGFCVNGECARGEGRCQVVPP